MANEINRGYFPQVTVLLAAYRSQDTIKESLLSIFEQTYPNIQLIICDDGTENFDENYLKDFLLKYDKNAITQIIHHQNNIGTVKNLNIGLRYATGHYIIILGADDCFACPDALVKLVELISEKKTKWAVSRTALCDERLIKRGVSLPSPAISEYIANRDVGALQFALSMNCCFPAGGAIFESELLTSVGGFDENYVLVEDWPLFLKLVRRGELPALSEEDLVLHRFGGVSRKNAGKNRKYQDDLINVLRKEVVPHLWGIAPERRIKIEECIKLKEQGYEFRFSNPRIIDKLIWVLRHPAFILHKLVIRREKAL